MDYLIFEIISAAINLVRLALNILDSVCRARQSDQGRTAETADESESQNEKEKRSKKGKRKKKRGAE